MRALAGEEHEPGCRRPGSRATRRSRPEAVAHAASGSLAPERSPTPNFTANVTGVLDVSILEPLFEDADGRELALELVDSFLEMAPELVKDMEAALEMDDLEACARIAHRFVSTSGTVGATQLARLLKEIEQQANAGCAEDAASLLRGCHELVELAGGALRTALAGDDPAPQ